jgi:hypothetical protein
VFVGYFNLFGGKGSANRRQNQKKSDFFAFVEM